MGLAKAVRERSGEKGRDGREARSREARSVGSVSPGRRRVAYLGGGSGWNGEGSGLTGVWSRPGLSWGLRGLPGWVEELVGEGTEHGPPGGSSAGR